MNIYHIILYVWILGVLLAFPLAWRSIKTQQCVRVKDIFAIMFMCFVGSWITVVTAIVALLANNWNTIIWKFDENK